MIELQATPDPLVWKLDVTDTICAGSINAPFLFGGSGLGALIAAMAASSNQPPVWATAQYLSYVKPPVVADIRVSIESAGKHITQATAALFVEDRKVITASGALGKRATTAVGSWITAPNTAAPETYPKVNHRLGYPEGVEKSIELRLVSGRYPVEGQEFDQPSDGRMLLWARPSSRQPITPDILAIIGDFVAAGSSHALGRFSAGNSLDNTIRFISAEPTDWVLCDIRIEAASAGFIHGSMFMFSQHGALMAIASTTLILRLPDSH